MIRYDVERVGRSSGRSQDDDLTDGNPTLRPSPRFRAQDDDDAVSGGLRHAAGVWREVAAKRRQSRKP